MRLIVLLCIVIAHLSLTSAWARDSILVFAPASMTDVLNDAAGEYESQSQTSVVLSFAGTQQLARQLDAGAPADIYITADRDWMDWSISRDLIVADNVFALAGNRLVVAVRNEVENWADLEALLTQNRFAMAEPDTVPAGRYARQALQQKGVWEMARRQAVFGDNVRTTLRRLARGEVTSAIVYGTDAAIEPRVRPFFVFPPKAHDQIIYWAAVTGKNPSAQALGFVSFLKGADAGRVFAKSGFVPPPSQQSSPPSPSSQQDGN
ncbi:MAG: molybdate ABC transporter substrate-binding protein [Rhizobiaceae bacterium]